MRQRRRWKPQVVIALSSGEAEYYGLVKGALVALGIREMMRDLGVIPAARPRVPVPMVTLGPGHVIVLVIGASDPKDAFRDRDSFLSSYRANNLDSRLIYV